MVTEPGVYSGPCPARELLERIANKWTALKREVEGISQQMLARTLKRLEEDGLVSRKLFPVIPPRVEYALTPLGLTLEDPMRALSAWTESHMHEVRESQRHFDRTRTPSANR